MCLQVPQTSCLFIICCWCYCTSVRCLHETFWFPQSLPPSVWEQESAGSANSPQCWCEQQHPHLTEHGLLMKAIRYMSGFQSQGASVVILSSCLWINGGDYRNRVVEHDEIWKLQSTKLNFQNKMCSAVCLRCDSQLSSSIITLFLRWCQYLCKLFSRKFKECDTFTVHNKIRKTVFWMELV